MSQHGRDDKRLVAQAAGIRSERRLAGREGVEPITWSRAAESSPRCLQTLADRRRSCRTRGEWETTANPREVNVSGDHTGGCSSPSSFPWSSPVSGCSGRLGGSTDGAGMRDPPRPGAFLRIQRFECVDLRRRARPSRRSVSAAHRRGSKVGKRRYRERAPTSLAASAVPIATLERLLEHRPPSQVGWILPIDPALAPVRNESSNRVLDVSS